MNDVFFNDTLENVLLTSSGQILHWKGTETQPTGSLVEDISIDDSIFLSDSFTFSESTNSENILENEDKNNIIEKLNHSKLKQSYAKLNVTINKSSSNNLNSAKIKCVSENMIDILKCDNIIELNKNDLNNFTKCDNIVKTKSSDFKHDEVCLNNDLELKNNEQQINFLQNNFEAVDIVDENNYGIEKELLKLSSWGLPEEILKKYASKKIESMFPWQIKCLISPGVLDKHKNLVYSAPTSAGKTLVAEILAIKTVLERRKKVIFILPFVSVVREKMFYFQDILGTSGVRVEGFMGSYNPPGGFRFVQVAICTIEKANGLINRMLQENTLSDIGAVIVDEMHLLGDASRGYLLELLLTKLRYMSLKDDNINIQIIGMSATLPNLRMLAKWLSAELFTTTFRPIALNEQCHVQGEIYNSEFKLLRKLHTIPELAMDADNMLQLCLETILNSCSVLIFCPTKSWCENLSQQMAAAILKLGCSKTELGMKLREKLNTELILECLEQLKRCPVGLDVVLSKSVSFGVAYHHAGLTMDERDIIEGSFRNGAIRILVATSTLSSGVNLPARRVIIRTPKFHGKPIDSLVYRQMIGRAGRMGKDTAGESVLICQKSDYNVAKELMSAKLPAVESCLEGAGKLKRAILEVIASDVASTPEEINLFTHCTLLANDDEYQSELNNPIEESIEFLVTHEFIRLQKLDDGSTKYRATSLAKACLSSSLPPEEGLALFTELEKARQCFVLETELHLIYLVTPYSACNQIGIDWMMYLDMWEKLPASMRRVGELVGVLDSYIISGTRGKIQTNTSKLYHKLQIHKRFYTSLALQDLVNEVSLNEVAAKFNCNRGMLQSLQQSAATFAAMVTAFSKQLGWSCVELLISQFQDRLQFGISRELLDLMKLPVLNGQRARALFNAGIETLVDLASTDVCVLENILHKIKPFETAKEREGESEYEAQKRSKVRTIWITGKQGLTEKEAALMLIQDSQMYLQLELGLSEARWSSDKVESESKGVNDIKDVNSELIDSGCKLEKGTFNNGDITSNNNLKINIINETIIDINEDVQPSYLNKKSENIQESTFSEHQVTNITNNFIGIKNDIKKIKVDIISDKQKVEVDKQEVITKEKSIDIKNSNCIEEQCNNIKELHQDVKEDHTVYLVDNRITSRINQTSNCFKEPKPVNLEKNNFIKNKDDSLMSMESLHVSETSLNSPDTINVSGGSRTNADSCFSILSRASRTNISSESLFGDSFEMNTQVMNNLSEIEGKPMDISNSFENESFFEKAFMSSFDKIQSVEKNITKRCREDSCYSEDDLIETPVKKAKLKFDKALVDFNKIEIIKVCDNDTLFQCFSNEVINENVISLSVACEIYEQVTPIIGSNILNKEKNPIGNNEFKYNYKNRIVKGISITWSGNNIVYYMTINNDVINLLKKLLSNENLVINLFDCKEQIKVLKQCCGIDFECRCYDPKIADWLLEPEGKEKNLQALTLEYSPEVTSLCQLAGNSKGCGSLGLELNNSIEARIRASIEAAVVNQVVDSLKDLLKQENVNLMETYNVEMHCLVILAKMEINGFGVDLNELECLADTLKKYTNEIETKAFHLAGRRFSFVSSNDVAKVLGMYNGKRVSTSKQVLEQNNKPISNLIMQWRKINCTLTKMVYPLLRLVENGRIHGCSITINSTGRISMHEPNLQNIPRDFKFEDPSTRVVQMICCRKAFVAHGKHVLLSADYCQLELRILAHLSQDDTLCSIMKSNADIFKSVAAKWNSLPTSEVSDTKRQQAKQICYGIIYGMGIKTLAEQLSVSDEEAADFVETFHCKYPGIRKYIKQTIEECREHGFVQTISGRKRFLPKISDSNTTVRSQAERQAVNTTIQGSAADIAKSAMVLIDNRIKEKFKSSRNKPYLVLQLHDELLYEVSHKYINVLGKIMKKSMQESVRLSVPFPVKFKSGTSWGGMDELII